MQSGNRDPETSAKLNRLTELAKMKINRRMNEESAREYEDLIGELSSILPEDDIAVEEAALMSVDEILGEKH